MTYDQWFRSQQGVAYEGSYLFAEAAWQHQQQRITALEKIIQRQQFIEDRYEELMLSCRRVYRYYSADNELFNASVKVMDFLIRRHATEIDEMDEEQE